MGMNIGKKRKKYRTGVCSLIIVFCCFLSACQNKGTENIKTLSESLNYKMEYYYFPEVSAAWKIKYFSGDFYVAGKNKDMNTIIGKVNEQGAFGGSSFRIKSGHRRFLPERRWEHFLPYAKKDERQE